MGNQPILSPEEQQKQMVADLLQQLPLMQQRVLDQYKNEQLDQYLNTVAGFDPNSEVKTDSTPALG